MNKHGLNFVKMRPVDIFIDVAEIDEKNSNRLQRSYNSARAIYKISKLGRSVVSKSNIALAFVDAALSVMDAISSYARYRQALEITKQLEMVGNALRSQIAEFDIRLRISEEINSENFSAQARLLKATLTEQSYELDIRLASYESCKKQVMKIGEVLILLRENSAPGCTKLKTLEKNYYLLVDTQLRIAIEIVDN